MLLQMTRETAKANKEKTQLQVYLVREGKQQNSNGRGITFSCYFYLVFELYHKQSLLLEVDAFLK